MTSKEALDELNIILKTNYETKRYSDIFEENLIKVIEKDLEVLEQYKDIEKEIGIDLITLFKALQNGVYVKRKNKYGYATQYIDCGNLSLNNKWHSNEYEAVQNDTTIYEGYNLTLLANKEWLYFNDYEKTWALTREELENGK